MAKRRHSSTVWRHRIYQVLDLGLAGDRLWQRVHWVLIALIVMNVSAVVLESVPALNERFHQLFLAIEIVSVVAFTVEYLARLWIAVEYGPLEDLPAWKARLVHALTPGMLVDLLSVLPFYLAWMIAADFRVLLVFRLLRFFKIARYSTGMRSLVDAIYTERQALAACAGILWGVVLISASFMHLAEQDAQPDKFGTIPDAMYWAVITLATVGYGDVVPVTMLGKMIASVTAVLGLGMVALPVGILATAFSDVIHRREFVVTWGMVARVPLFRGLDADAIAELMRYLRSQTVQPGQIICRKGEKAHSMYFIAAGEVEVDVPGKNVNLVVGDFFGEIALLTNVNRTATVRARSRASLLMLDASDVHGLMERRPDVGKRLRDIAASRLAADAVQDHGDLTREDLKHHGD